MREITSEEAGLLEKLYRRRCFGAKHLLISNLLQGYPPDRIGDMKGALRDLMREGIIRKKKTEHGDAAFLIPSLGPDIYDQLKRHYPFLPPPPWRHG